MTKKHLLTILVILLLASAAVGQTTGDPATGGAKTLSGGTSPTTKNVTCGVGATPGVSQNLCGVVIPVSQPTTFPTNGASTNCTTVIQMGGTCPAASWTLSLQKQTGCTGSWTQFGTVTVSTSCVATYSVTQTTLNVGDCFQPVTPSSLDSNPINPTITFCMVQ